MEGLGMPPIEAAVAGNKVIGYRGRGGNEYWQKPILKSSLLVHTFQSQAIKQFLYLVEFSESSQILPDLEFQTDAYVFSFS